MQVIEKEEEKEKEKEKEEEDGDIETSFCADESDLKIRSLGCDFVGFPSGC